MNGVANLLAVNQNLPFCHVEQAWNANTGAALPGYPRATDDFQLLSQASVARVAGSGPQRQALVGTGMYQVHAYGPTGLEAPGWPKFTGGWTQSTPAVGDADGDGKLDVAALTREGWSFLWKTAGPRLRQLQQPVVDLPPRRARQRQLPAATGARRARPGA